MQEEIERLALIVESSEDAIIDKAMDGVIKTSGRTAERMYGYPAGEVIGRPCPPLLLLISLTRFPKSAWSFNR